MSAKVKIRQSGDELELWEDVPPGSMYETAFQVLLERTKRLEQYARAAPDFGWSCKFLDHDGVKVIPE